MVWRHSCQGGLDMPRTLIENVVTGTGDVYRPDGSLVGTARYRLVFLREPVEAGADLLAGLQRIEGQLSGVDAMAMTMEQLDGPYCLHLEDGRCWDFEYVDVAVTSGRGRGLYRPD